MTTAPPSSRPLAAETNDASRRALAAFPAGSNGEFNWPAELVPVVGRAVGARLWDAEGRDYLDFSMGWGSVLPGHANPRVLDAVRRQLDSGTNFAAVTERSLELAERLIAISPACERVRFCASGTEATMYCLRLARAFTGRPAVLRFEGAYHGAHDVGVTSLFPQSPPPTPLPDPSSDGLDPAIADHVLVAPFNDAETASELIATHAHRLGAVIVEPLQRCLPPVPGFLESIRRATAEHGVPLIFDEVVTGFRLALSGAQQKYGVVPDLVAYGKALGGGLPIGAFGGPRQIMSLVEEHRLGTRRPYVWTASSLGGNPVSSAAALAAIDLYAEPGTYERLDAGGAQMRQQMRAVLRSRGVSGHVIGDGPLAQVVFTDAPTAPLGYRDLLRADRDRARRVMLALLRRGIFLNPMGTKLYLSTAHDARVVGAFADRFDAALAAVLSGRE